MATDLFVQLVSIQPSQATLTSSQQAPGGKAIPHGGHATKGGLYSDRRKKACTTGK